MSDSDSNGTHGNPVQWLLGEVRAIFREELRASRQGDEWIDQYRSPLRLPDQKFSRRHVLLVRRRMAAGLSGAYVSPDGKQFFLTTAALSEEASHPMASTSPEPAADAERDETAAYERALLARVRSK